MIAVTKLATVTKRVTLRHRTVRILAVGVALVAVTAAGGCGAGKLAQTAQQVPPVAGVSLDFGPSLELGLRNVQVAYQPGGYPQGATAPLVVRIFNSGDVPVTLTAVNAPNSAEKVVLVGTPVVTPEPSPTPASPTPPASPSSSPTGQASASALPTGSPSAAPSRTPAAPAGREDIRITIAPRSYVLLVPGQDAFLQLIGLTRPLLPGLAVQLVFTFDNGVTAHLDVPMALPAQPLPRGTPEVHEAE